mgnify:CR=1 FL=1
MATLRFHLIAEAEARQIPEGATVELEPGGHVTPLARDTLAARRITLKTYVPFGPFLVIGAYWAVLGAL